MQIKQLPEYSGTPTDASVFPLDDNTHTYKLTFAALVSAIITNATLTLNNATQTVKAAVDSIGASLKGLTDIITTSGTTATFSGNIETPTGTLTSGSSTKTGESRINVITSTRACRLVARNTQGDCGLYDTTNSRYFLQSDADQVVKTINFDTSLRPVLCTTGTANRRIKYIQSQSGGITVNAESGNNSFGDNTISYDSSDRNLKENIEDCNADGLAMINALRCRQFDWKDGRGHWDYGLIAQEVMEIDGNLVVGGGESPYGISTLYLVDILVKAVQELSAEVEELKNGG